MSQSGLREKPLSSIVRDCLPTLNSISANLLVYGDEKMSEQLSQVIAELRMACPESSSEDSMNFIVNGTFKVSRQQVAATLFHAFSSELDWFDITEAIEPPLLEFRVLDHLQVRFVDYPLNEGGEIVLIIKDDPNQKRKLNLAVIGVGLEILANKYPRHFADLINENSDTITANAFLQSCVFGEILHD